jgi:hypothetical protein
MKKNILVILLFVFALSKSYTAENTELVDFTLSEAPVSCDISYTSQNQSELSKMVDLSKDLSNSVNENERWSDYLTDRCKTKVDNHDVSTQLFKCKDGTFVHKQPKSTGIGGWNGYCGETAMSNINYMYCNYITSPKKYCAAKATDGTPGIRPGVLAHVMNDYFDSHETCPKGKWVDYYESSTPEEFLDYLVAGINHKGITKRKVGKTEKEVSPFPIMLDSFPLGGSVRHWVTVVDIVNFEGKDKVLTKQKKCMVVVNHWGNQYKVPCHRLAAAAEASGNGIVGMVTGSYPRVKFVPAAN